MSNDTNSVKENALKKYNVSYMISISQNVEVYAESEEQAKDKVYDMHSCDELEIKGDYQDIDIDYVEEVQ